MRSTSHARRQKPRHDKSAADSWTHHNPAGRKREYHNPYKLKHDKKSTHSCLDMLRGHLHGVKFRELNEQMCQKKSTENASLFGSDPKLFADYHKGYDYQRSQWKEDPLDNIIHAIPSFRSWYERTKQKFVLKEKSKQADLRGNLKLETPNGPLVVGDDYFVLTDLGCGTGKLVEEFMLKGPGGLGESGAPTIGEFQFDGTSVKCITHEKTAVCSFDLISAKPFVTSVDITTVPLPSQSTSLVVLCLAMIGSNYLDVLLESYRVLSSRGGMIVIAEVSSRLKTEKSRVDFVRLMESAGFQNVHISSKLQVDSLNEQTTPMEEDNLQEASNDEFFLYITAVKYNDLYIPLEWKKKNAVKSTSPRIHQLLTKNFLKIRSKNGLIEGSEEISALITWQRNFILRKYHPEKIVTPYTSKGRQAENRKEPWRPDGREHKRNTHQSYDNYRSNKRPR